jgi:hypothetical protein
MGFFSADADCRLQKLWYQLLDRITGKLKLIRPRLAGAFFEESGS